MIPVALTVAIFLSSLTRDNVAPCYTAGVAVTDDGRLLLANKGTSQLQMLSAGGGASQGVVARRTCYGCCDKR